MNHSSRNQYENERAYKSERNLENSAKKPPSNLKENFSSAKPKNEPLKAMKVEEPLLYSSPSMENVSSSHTIPIHGSRTKEQSKVRTFQN